MLRNKIILVEGIRINEDGFILIHDEIYKSPLGRTNGKYLKRKVHEMVEDSYHRRLMNEAKEYWQSCNKSESYKQKILKMLKSIPFVTHRLK